MLVRHPASLLSQHYLFTEVWGPGYETARGNLRRYMARLRKRLELEPSRPQYFRTEPGMGYRFRPWFSQGPTGPELPGGIQLDGLRSESGVPMNPLVRAGVCSGADLAPFAGREAS